MLSTAFASVTLVSAVWLASSTWERVKTKPSDRVIRVTGSATKRITSDLILWRAHIEVDVKDRSAGYRELKRQVDEAVAYLTEHGVAAEDLSVSSTTVNELFETVVEGTGEDRMQRSVPAGFTMRQTITVSSAGVSQVERVSREVTELLERGITIRSETPEYHYTKLGELKIEMLAEASADARSRADHIVEAAGQDKVSRLVQANMGIININPPNSRASSWDGNNDTSSQQKDIITVVHASFELED